MQIVNSPCPISVKPVRMWSVSSSSTVIAALPMSGMPLPMPTFLMPQAMPAYFALLYTSFTASSVLRSPNGLSRICPVANASPRSRMFRSRMS